jgi:hypothetical protein
MPPKEIRELRVDLDRYVKLAAKGISVEEVRQAVANASRVYRGPRNHPGQRGQCYFIESRTDAGRLLKVLVRRFDGGYANLITAWEPR